jgi:hypothetical protein
MGRSPKLSNLVVPELYDLKIIPTNFHGAVVITFSIRALSPFAGPHGSDSLTILPLTQDSAPI